MFGGFDSLKTNILMLFERATAEWRRELSHKERFDFNDQAISLAGDKGWRTRDFQFQLGSLRYEIQPCHLSRSWKSAYEMPSKIFGEQLAQLLSIAAAENAYPVIYIDGNALVDYPLQDALFPSGDPAHHHILYPTTSVQPHVPHE